jgi:hypothetical protein
MKEGGLRPLSEPDDRDAHLASLVGEFVLDPRAWNGRHLDMCQSLLVMPDCALNLLACDSRMSETSKALQIGMGCPK